VKYSFHSLDELFQAVRDLMAALEAKGHAAAAAELREGFSCLNGLTDGWAMFLDSIERVRRDKSLRLDREDKKALDRIRGDVWKIVYRR